MKLHHTLFFLLLFATFNRCSKDAVELPIIPPFTKPVDCSNAQGNCFRCEIFGEEWVAQVHTGFGSVAHYVVYNPNNDELYIQLTREIPSENKYESMKVYISDLEKGNIHLNLGQGQAHAYTDYNQNIPCYETQYNPNYPGNLQLIQHDTVNNILEAKFSLTFYNPACGADSLIEVTNGHFRIHY